MGAFTRDSDPTGSQVLGVQPIGGDRITVEYRVPKGMKPGRLRIGQITHAYRDVQGWAKAFGDSGSCNNNTICPLGSGWENQISSVAMIVVGGGGICTGQLINNCASNGTPYFLTANHCLGGSLSTWVFRFNWESPTCTPTQNAPTNQTVSGATLLATNSGSDAALLQLSSAPPAAYAIYYTGWDRSGTTPNQQTCIHHPSGDIKKITRDNNAPGQSTVNLGNGNAQCWRIFNWESGTTEGGSSGSGLWDQNKLLIGQLYGGTASCSNNIDDYFGRFDISYPAFQNWLGACGNTLSGYDPNAPTVGLDAQLNAINGFGGNSCNSVANPVVVVRNGGSLTLTSFTLNWQLNGGGTQSQGWSGSLASGATVNINLPAQTLVSGPNSLTAWTASPNGAADQVPANDQATANMTYGNNTLTLQLNLDRYGDETTWSITSTGGGTTYASGGPYTQQAANGVYPLAPITICLPSGCYELRVADSFGDGICCQWGNGTFNLSDAAGNGLASGGTFTTLSVNPFCVPYVCTAMLPFTTNFDASLGGFTQDGGDNFDWSRFNAATPTTNTGPDADHTSGTGYYMFIESSAPNNPNLTARLLSPCFDLSGYSTVSMTFWRHMFGATTGSLNVDVQMNGGAWTNGIWTLSGNQGNSWVQATVNLTPYISSNTRFRFRGTTGNGGTGDIAIDDVGLTGTTGVKVAVKLWLEGPLVIVAPTLMDDDLRVAALIPTTEPYSALGFSNAGGGGGETTTAGVLGAGGNNAIVDWGRVELRSSADPASIVATRQCLIQRDGDVVSAVDGTSEVTVNVGAGNYYVAVRHRNHLGCMTASAIALTSSPTTIDFRSSATPTWGTDARKNVSGQMALWSGNTLHDSPAPFLLKYTGGNNDRDPILVAIGGSVPTATITGYHEEDCNLDGTVKYTGSANDRDLILVNIGGSVPTLTRAEQLP
jgi:hypothetical protein